MPVTKICDKQPSSSEAAELLFISQSAVSQNIKKLEHELGLTLFDRTKNSMKLNGNGRKVLEYAEEIFDAVDRLRNFALDKNSQQKTQIHIATSIPSCLRYYIPLFNSIYNGAFITGSLEDSDRLEEGLKSKTYDCIIKTGCSEEKEFKNLPLFTDRLYVGVPKENALAEREKLSFFDLAGQTVLTMMENKGNYNKIIKSLQRKYGVSPSFITENDYFVYMEKCKSNDCLILVSVLSLQYNKPLNRVYIPLTDKETQLECVLTTLKDCDDMVEDFWENVSFCAKAEG